MIVGDRLETDIVMGKRLGLATVLVLTGITAAGDARIAATAPDLVVPSIRDARQFLVAPRRAGLPPASRVRDRADVAVVAGQYGEGWRRRRRCPR